MHFPLYLIRQIGTFQSENFNEYAHAKTKLSFPHLIAYSENCFLNILKYHFPVQLMCWKRQGQYGPCIFWIRPTAFHLSKSANPWYIIPRYCMDSPTKLYSSLMDRCMRAKILQVHIFLILPKDNIIFCVCWWWMDSDAVFLIKSSCYHDFQG